MRGEWLPGHRDVAGIYFAYANANIDVTGLVTNEAVTNYALRKTGRLDLNGWSGGAYWTHYGPTGWYLDAVVQATAYEGSASTTSASLSTNGAGFASSLEAGYPLPVPARGPRFVLEPQAQIVWQHVSFDDDNDGLGDVALGSTSGASGRLGLARPLDDHQQPGSFGNLMYAPTSGTIGVHERPRRSRAPIGFLC